VGWRYQFLLKYLIQNTKTPKTYPEKYVQKHQERQQRPGNQLEEITQITKNKREISQQLLDELNKNTDKEHPRA